MVCEVFPVKEAPVRYVSLTWTGGDHLYDILANEGAADSHGSKERPVIFIHFLGCMLIMAACFTYAHCAYNLLLSMLDCYRMHHAVTWWVIGTQ